MFSIELHKDDLNVLEDIKNYLGDRKSLTI